MGPNNAGQTNYSPPSSGASGAAGGDLTGTYPNPTIGTGKIVNAQIASNAAIDGTKISPVFGTQAMTITGNITVSGVSTLTVPYINSTGGNIQAGYFNAANTPGYYCLQDSQTVFKVGASQDVSFGRYAPGVLSINNGTAGSGGGVHISPGTAPSTPASGFILYVDSGDSNKLKVKSAGGTVTTLALQ